MRGRQRLLAIALAVAVLLSIGVTSLPVGRAAGGTQLETLRARRNQLVAQLAALQPSVQGGVSALGTLEQGLAVAQARLLSEQQQLTGLNARLLDLSGSLAGHRATIDSAKHQLAALARQSYESTTNNSWVAAVLSASTFAEAMDRLNGTAHVASAVATLQANLRQTELAIIDEQAQIRKDVTASSSAETQFADDSNALLVLVGQRDAALQGASGAARALVAQIADIDQQIAGQSGPAAPRSVSSAPCGDHFGYGQCTYYVASRRCIPWGGNARDWFANAARFGYPEGHTPAVGAVVTFWPGGDGASSIGHVAFVEVVGPAAGVPAGSFKVSEMNYNGWNQVDSRIVRNDSAIQGFIYER